LISFAEDKPGRNLLDLSTTPALRATPPVPGGEFPCIERRSNPGSAVRSTTTTALRTPVGSSLIGLFRRLAGEVFLQGFNGLLITSLKKGSHRFRFFIGAVAEARAAQSRVRAVELRQCHYGPRFFPGFLEWKRSRRFLNPRGDHCRRLVGKDHVFDR